MHCRKSLTGTFVCAALALALVASAVAVALPSVATQGLAFAKEGKGGNGPGGSGKSDDEEKDGGDDKDNGKGNDDKKEKKERDDKGGNGNDDTGNDDNGGKGNAEDRTPVVIVQAPDTTPIPVTPAPTGTAAPQANGTLAVVVRSCGGTPVAGADWTGSCTQPVTKARFELTALDGPFAGWHRDLESDDAGAADLGELPAGRYDLVPDGIRWCHAESDRVDADGKIAIVGGQTTTVWIFTCDPAPTGS